MLYGEVQRQRLKIIKDFVVADTIDYLEMQFSFSEDWAGLSKWAHFSTMGRTYDIPLTDNRIRKEDHLNLSAGIWAVYLHGNEFAEGLVVERITTNAVVMRVEPTGTLDGEPFPEMPASETERILARLARLEAGGGGSGEGGGIFFLPGNALELNDGVLNVKTAEAAEQDNTLPITSAGVHTIVGNIGAILDTI